MFSYIQYRHQLEGIESVAQTVKVVEKIAASHLEAARLKMEQVSSAWQAHIRLGTQAAIVREIVLPTFKGKGLVIGVGSVRGLVANLNIQILNECLKTNNAHLWLMGERLQKKAWQQGINAKNITQIENAEEVEKIVNDIYLLSPKSITIYHARPVQLTNTQVVALKILPLNLTNESALSPLRLPLIDFQIHEFWSLWFVHLFRLSLLKASYESNVAELGLRTVSAEHATAKAKERLDTIKQNYHRVRRDLLTQQQIVTLQSSKRRST